VLNPVNLVHPVQAGQPRELQSVFSKSGARPPSAAATDLPPAVFKDFQRFGNLEAAAPEDGRAPGHCAQAEWTVPVQAVSRP
jgi:hypothetical protein